MTVAKTKHREPDGKNRRREASNEAKAILRTLRISPQKLNLVAQSIRGLSAEKAVNELRFISDVQRTDGKISQVLAV